MKKSFKLFLFSIPLFTIPSFASANGMGRAIEEAFSLYILWPIIIVATVSATWSFFKHKKFSGTETTKEGFAVGILIVLNLLLIIVFLSPFLSSFFVDPQEMRSTCFLDHYGPRRICGFYQGSIRNGIFREFVPIFAAGWFVFTLYFLIRKYFQKNPVPYSASRIFSSFLIVALGYLVFIIGHYIFLFSKGYV